MKKTKAALLTISVILGWASSGITAESDKSSVYYTRVGFFYEKGAHNTVNYLRGLWVPVNTEVKVLKRDKRSISIRIVDTGASVKIVNKEGFTGEGINGIFDRMLSPKPTDLTAYSPEQRSRIMGGNFEPGMTKEEIILAIGYPPRHRTPSLESNAWRYWRNKFNTVILHFKDGVLYRVVE